MAGNDFQEVVHSERSDKSKNRMGIVISVRVFSHDFHFFMRAIARIFSPWE